MPNIPPLATVGLLSSFGLFIASLVLAVLAIIYFHGARRRAKNELGNWVGMGKARIGLALGWLTLAFPVLAIIAGIVFRK